jgi:hypothetical protein
MRLAVKRLARAATIAAAIVALSGSLATGRPLFATLGDVAFKLTAGFSEVEEMRRKINRGPRAAAFVVRDANSEFMRMGRGDDQGPSCSHVMRRGVIAANIAKLPEPLRQ